MIEYPEEFKDVYKVLDMGASKYGANSWLEGRHFNHKDNHASMCRHLAQSFCGNPIDDESGLNHYLHLACRALMAYTVQKRHQDKIHNRGDSKL